MTSSWKSPIINEKLNGQFILIFHILQQYLWVFFVGAITTSSIMAAGYPANTTHRPSVGSMLGRRRRQRANTGPALGRCVVFAGYSRVCSCLF